MAETQWKFQYTAKEGVKKGKGAGGIEGRGSERVLDPVVSARGTRLLEYRVC